MAEIEKKLKIYKKANATTYTADLYTDKDEANGSPLALEVDGQTVYASATTVATDEGVIPLRVAKDDTTYYIQSSGYVSGSIVITSSQEFKVPTGVKKVYITAAAGGGGGGGGSRYYTYTSGSGENASTSTYHNPGSAGSRGGSTSFGSFLTLTGGYGGSGGYAYSSGSGGSTGSPYAGVVNSSYGIGGSGGPGQGNGGNGGNGGTCSRYEVTVAAGRSYSVTIGAGGSGGSGGISSYNGSAGRQGYMLIEW